MTALSHIIKDFDFELIGDINQSINKPAFDSRKVSQGDLFIAVPGTRVDGHDYIQKAIDLGASAIVCERLPKELNNDICYLKVKDSQKVLGLIASAFYGYPTSNIRLVGVTGTNGKTSIVTLLHELFQSLGYKCGLLSTVCNKIGDQVLNSTHTTPDAIAINQLLDTMVEDECEFAFMEVSSHAIDQKRIEGLKFEVAAFTNITHDHLDYHKTFDNYIHAKKSFFDALDTTAKALVNKDDKNAMVMVQNTRAAVKTFGLKSLADFKGKIIESHFDGMLLNVDKVEIWTKIVGAFNASNLLAVYGISQLLGCTKDEALQAISSLDVVDGRFETIQSRNGLTAIVDYAHTPDALKNVIETINQIRSLESNLITVVGAGGNRDKEKRPKMGKIACEGSDKVVFTSDNPRDEDPVEIIADMQKDLSDSYRQNSLAITNRREAIRTATMLAKPGDIILIAGKGHETYQEIKGEKTFFSDKEEINKIFSNNTETA